MTSASCAFYFFCSSPTLPNNFHEGDLSGNFLAIYNARLLDHLTDIKQRNSHAVLDFENQIKEHPLEDFNAFIEFPEIRQHEKYLSKKEVIKK